MLARPRFFQAGAFRYARAVPRRVHRRVLLSSAGCLLTTGALVARRQSCFADAGRGQSVSSQTTAKLTQQADASPEDTGDASVVALLSSWLRSWLCEIFEGLRIVQRSAYLACVFGPTVFTSPVLLLAGPDSFLVQWWWKLVRFSICTSGPCNIKFSQWVATRPDLFPLVVCQQLQDLQTNAIRCSWHDTRSTLCHMFGPRWNETLHLDVDSDGRPIIIGSGCVAQVLRGRLGDSQTPVAVKVIHPHVAKSIKDDIRIMRFLCRVVERMPSFCNLGLGESVDQFSLFMESQLDLRSEAASLMRFRKNFGCDSAEKGSTQRQRPASSSITFPEPMYPYVTRLALVEAFEEGDLMLHLVDDMDGPTRHKLATMGLDAILKMVFQDNFIHADLHMGNIICQPLQQPGEYRMAMIDAGLIAELEPGDRRNFIDLFKAIVLNDGRRVGRLIIERSLNFGLCRNPEKFELELQSVVSAVHSSGLSLGRMGVGELLKRVLVSCYENNVKLEPRFVTIVLSIGVVEGLGRRLDPDVDILTKAAPYVLKAALTMDK